MKFHLFVQFQTFVNPFILKLYSLKQKPKERISSFLVQTLFSYFCFPYYSSFRFLHEPICYLRPNLFQGHPEMDRNNVITQSPGYQSGWELGHIRRLELLGHSKLSVYLTTKWRKYHEQGLPWHMYRPRTSTSHSLSPLNFGFDFPSMVASASIPVTPGPPIKLNPSQSV